jgi:3D (Asp-Asp-Asp) domain-containing protein
MTWRTKSKLAILTIPIAAFALYSIWWDTAVAAELEAETLMPVKITGYCVTGTTAGGVETRSGICAYRPKDIGKTAIVYNSEREVIGIYEIMDTGSENIREGRTLDIWCETEEECYQLTQNGFIQIVDAEG